MSAVGLVILAAGGSRRLGVPKQLLRDGAGRSLVRRAAQTALASGCRPVTVVLGASAEAISREIADLPLGIVHNPGWETGMASSLRAGLTALTAHTPLDAALVMLCDQPMVSAALLDSLAAAHRSSGHDLVACEYEGVLGVPALFGHALFGALRALTGDEGARRVIKAYAGPATRVPFPEGRLDIDTADDAEALLLSA